jgi:hypothetical protein
MKTVAKKFKELKMGDEFWDYHPDDQGDLFIKISMNLSMHKERKYIVDWKPDCIIEVEIK